MGTKNNPGQFDCYANAAPDEPMFVLLARDDIAPILVRIWAAAKSDNDAHMRVQLNALGRAVAKRRLAGKTISREKHNEATHCSVNMEEWKANNPDI